MCIFVTYLVRIKPTHITTFVMLVSLSIITFFNLFCGDADKKSTPENTYLNHNDTVKYVGMETCRSCHNDIYKTFIETGMGQSFNVATKQKSAAKFGKHQLVHDKFNNLSYYPYFLNDTMYIMEFRLDGKDTVHKRVERVDYIVGSGQHTNSHMMEVNGFVYQMPLTWYAQKGKWDLPPGFENGQNVRFNRAIGLECMSCHNAMPTFAKNSTNKFISIPKGIDCERCHGPGELHVKEKLAGNIVDTATQIDYTIVNPKKLSWDLQIDVCQRCHLQGNAVLKNDKDFTDFRPGKRLGDYIDIYMPKYKGRDDEFIMASHAQRLQMSKCFVGGNQHTNKLTCISCHNPHVSVKVTGTQIFNNSCNSCHSTQQKNFCTETPAKIKLANNNCVSCHMPKSGTIDIPHVTVTDHWIRVPATQKAKEAAKEFAGIYCINNPESDLETRGKAYLGYFEKFSGEKSSVDSADKYFSITQNQPNTTEAWIHLWYLKQDYASIIKKASSLKPNDQTKPWLCYRIGRAYYNNNNFNLAEGWYKKAVELASENLDFINALGALYVQVDENEKAITTLESSLSKNPKQPEPLTNLGFVYAKQQQFDKALGYYNRAIALDPDFEQALLNKAAVLNITGQKLATKQLLQRLLKLNPNNIMVKQLLQQM